MTPSLTQRLRSLFAEHKKQTILWLVILALCAGLTVFVMICTGNAYNEPAKVSLGGPGDGELTLAPGSVLEQSFLIRGRLGGLLTHLHVASPEGADPEGRAAVRLINQDDGQTVLEKTVDASQLGEISADGEIFLPSGKTFRLEIINLSDSRSLTLGYQPRQQTGTLTVDGGEQTGCLDVSLTRIGTYHPTPLFYLALLLVNGTVLAGSALVLFRKPQTHVLYLILAVGFGLATLLDLTPLYGFDMRFHFDCTYVLSNQMLGLERTVETPSLEDPEEMTLSYYRRAEDDYTNYAHYYFDFVSSNYTDTYQGLKNFGTTQDQRELELVQTYQNNVSGQFYLYLPQAVAFALARLLGLGFYPMLQLARLAAYGAFVALVYRGIRRLPFGEGLFLILGLLPATLAQTVSITRDGLILGMSFYVIAKGLTLAYTPGLPRKGDWFCLIAVSILLAPCKMAYLPVSFFYLLAVYRKCFREGCLPRKQAAAAVSAVTVATLAMFLLTNGFLLSKITETGKTDIYGTVAYSMSDILGDPFNTLYVLINTFRNQLGAYFVNAVQLFDIKLGSSEGITLAFGILLMLEIGAPEPVRRDLRGKERGFSFLVFLGVLALVTYGAMQWTPNTSLTIEGLQGRYLTPVLPALCFALYGGRLWRCAPRAKTVVELGCCVLPAIVLMNMYLWTIFNTEVLPDQLPWPAP